MVEMEQNLIQAAVIKQPIIENAVYEREEAIAITGFSLSTLIRAEKSGELKGRNIGRRRYYLGADLLKWLQGDEEGDGKKGREWKKR
jgi:helix-turn-helix protein